MAVTTAFAQFETILYENLGNAVINLDMREVDDPALRMMQTFQPLGAGGRPATTANGWEARRKIKLSRGGMITGGTFTGNTVQSLGANNDLPTGQSADAVAPDPTKVPLTQYQTITANLKRILGNVTVNMQQLMSDMLGDEIEEVAVGHIEDAVFQVRKNMMGWFYGDGSGSLAQASAATPGTIDATEGGTGIAIKTGTYSRFIKGQRYQCYSNTNWPTTKTLIGAAGEAFRCVKIDDVNETVYFEEESGNTDVVVTTDAHFVLMGSNSGNTSLVPQGIEYMFKESGAFYGISDITQYPELMSRVEGSESAKVDPEPERFAKLYDAILESGTEPPTVFVSERSLQTQYALLEKKGYGVYNLPGMMPTANGGVTGAVFQHGTRIVPWEVSSYIRPGSVWGAAPETIHKFQPGGNDTIRWWNARGPVAGTQGIFVPVMSSSQQTELMQAPFETHCEFLPVNPKRNFRHIGLHTQKTA